MTRDARIELNRLLGLPTHKFEAMTDAQFESQYDFETERNLRRKPIGNLK